MLIKDLTLFSLDEIYSMSPSDFKSLELIKRLLVDERKKRLDLNEVEKVAFIDETIKTLVTLQTSNGIGHNLD